MIYLYWLAGLGFALTVSILLCVATEAKEPSETDNAS